MSGITLDARRILVRDLKDSSQPHQTIKLLSYSVNVTDRRLNRWFKCVRVTVYFFLKLQSISVITRDMTSFQPSDQVSPPTRLWRHLHPVSPPLYHRLFHYMTLYYYIIICDMGISTHIRNTCVPLLQVMDNVITCATCIDAKFYYIQRSLASFSCFVPLRH